MRMEVKLVSFLGPRAAMAVPSVIAPRETTVFDITLMGGLPQSLTFFLYFVSKPRF
jgi:hypothetical protein